AFERAQCLDCARTFLDYGAQLLDQRAPDLLAHDGVELLRVTLELSETGGDELLLRLRCLQQQTVFHRCIIERRRSVHSSCSAASRFPAVGVVPAVRAAAERRRVRRTGGVAITAATAAVGVATRGVATPGVTGSAGMNAGATPSRTTDVRGGCKATRNQCSREANLRYPARSGNCSISESITAGSMLNCWLRVTEPSICVHRRLLDSVVRTTSRCPISVEANRDVPPPSLAEHRRISVLPQ